MAEGNFWAGGDDKDGNGDNDDDNGCERDRKDEFEMPAAVEMINDDDDDDYSNGDFDTYSSTTDLSSIDFD